MHPSPVDDREGSIYPPPMLKPLSQKLQKTPIPIPILLNTHTHTHTHLRTRSKSPQIRRQLLRRSDGHGVIVASADTPDAAVALQTLETERGGAGKEIGFSFGGEDAEADVHAGAG
jgi:hypothetical protein